MIDLDTSLDEDTPMDAAATIRLNDAGTVTPRINVDDPMIGDRSHDSGRDSNRDNRIESPEHGVGQEHSRHDDHPMSDPDSQHNDHENNDLWGEKDDEEEVPGEDEEEPSDEYTEDGNHGDDVEDEGDQDADTGVDMQRTRRRVTNIRPTDLDAATGPLNTAPLPDSDDGNILVPDSDDHYRRPATPTDTTRGDQAGSSGEFFTPLFLSIMPRITRIRICRTSFYSLPADPSTWIRGLFFVIC